MEDKRNNLIDYFDEYYPSKNIIPESELNINNNDFNINNFLELKDVLSDIDITVDVLDDRKHLI